MSKEEIIRTIIEAFGKMNEEQKAETIEMAKAILKEREENG